MSKAVKINRTFTLDGETITAPQTLTVDGVGGIDGSLTASQADQEYAITIDVSQLKYLYILASNDCTVETNSSSSPVDTITPKAGVPYVWTYGSGVTNPLGTDVTKIFVTNGAASVATFKMRVGLDASI